MYTSTHYNTTITWFCIFRMIRQVSLANVVVVVHISREMDSMMTPLRLSSAYCYSSDSTQKPAAMEPPDLPPLDIDDLPSKTHDSAPPSVNDQVKGGL